MSERHSAPLIEMNYTSIKQNQAIEELEKEFCLDKTTLLNVVESFREELVLGLAEDKSSDLNMLPTYVSGYPTGYERGTYLALEIAGMDIFACQVKLKGEAGKLAINQYQYKIPEDLASGDDVAVLIDYVVECISDFLLRVGTQDDFVYPMAVSFGFAIQQTRLDSGRILSLGYGLNYPNSVGIDIVELMHERIRLNHLPIKIVATANDSVCTLLAHAYQHPTTRLGIVHSLGTNCSYYETLKNVTKLNDQTIAKDTDMIMNTEWCNFGSSKKTLPCTWFDKKLERESGNPQFHIFEKMTTGIFLGELVRIILTHFIDQDILFGGKTSEVLNTHHSFDTSYMYVCEADDTDEFEDTRVVLEDMLGLSETTLSDRAVVKKVCELVGTRAAMLVGASIAAIVQHMIERGIGMSEDGYAISISGSVYEDYPSFHPRVCRTLKDLISEEIAGKLSVGIVKHSRIVGAAIVAMLAEKSRAGLDTFDEC